MVNRICTEYYELQKYYDQIMENGEYGEYGEYGEFIGDVHFFCFDWKYPFGANLVQKVRIVSLNRTLTFQTKMCYLLH